MALQLIGYIFEIIAITAGIIAGIAALKRDPRYRINQLMAAAMFSLALYVLFILIYDVGYYYTENPQIILRSYPLALVFIVSASLLLFLAMNAVVRSSEWLKSTKNWIIHVSIFIIYAIFINVYDFIEIIEVDPVDTQINLLVLGIVIMFVLYYLIRSIFITFSYGIKKSQGITQTKMKIFLVGLCIDLGSVFINIVSQVSPNLLLGQIFDIIFFGLIAIGNIAYSIGFLLKNEIKPEACLNC